MQQELESIRTKLELYDNYLKREIDGILGAHAPGNSEELKQLRAERLQCVWLIKKLHSRESRLSAQAGQGAGQGTGHGAGQGLGQGARQGAGQGAGQGSGQGPEQGPEQGARQGAGQGAGQDAGQGAGQGSGQGAPEPLLFIHRFNAIFQWKRDEHDGRDGLVEVGLKTIFYWYWLDRPR